MGIGICAAIAANRLSRWLERLSGLEEELDDWVIVEGYDFNEPITDRLIESAQMSFGSIWNSNRLQGN